MPPTAGLPPAPQTADGAISAPKRPFAAIVGGSKARRGEGWRAAELRLLPTACLRASSAPLSFLLCSHQPHPQPHHPLPAQVSTKIAVIESLLSKVPPPLHAHTHPNTNTSICDAGVGAARTETLDPRPWVDGASAAPPHPHNLPSPLPKKPKGGQAGAGRRHGLHLLQGTGPEVGWGRLGLGVSSGAIRTASGSFKHRRPPPQRASWHLDPRHRRTAGGDGGGQRSHLKELTTPPPKKRGCLPGGG